MTQTDARGRQGRAWIVPEGNLSTTLIYKPVCIPTDAAKRSFLAANALFEALSYYVDPARLGLKWPNDVLLGGGKVAGILLESSGGGGQVDWLSVGIGVNLSHAPMTLANAVFPPVSLCQYTDDVVSPEDFLTKLASAFATQEMKLATMGFARIREDWLQHAARLGETIIARTTKEEITGVFETIDDDGQLILQTAKGRQAVSAADVYFG